MDPLFVIQMLLVGVGVGLISTGLGLGGGLIMVPAFLAVIPEMDIHTAKGTSLFIIIFVAAMNSWRLNRGHGDYQLKLAGFMACGAVVGSYLGGWLTTLLPESIVVVVFVVLIGFAALRTFVLKQQIVKEEDVRARNGLAVLIGFLAGTVAGATGTGGGAIMVPLMLIAGIVSNARVVALSNTVMVATAIAGTLAHVRATQTVDLPWTVGQVNFAVAPLIFIGAQAIGPVGKMLNAWLTLKRRRIVMGVFLLVIALSLLRRLL